MTEAEKHPLWQTFPALLLLGAVVLGFREVMLSAFDEGVAVWITVIPCISLAAWFFTSTKTGHLWGGMGLAASGVLAWITVSTTGGKWGYGIIILFAGALLTAIMVQDEKRLAREKERKEAKETADEGDGGNKQNGKGGKAPESFHSVRALPSLDDLGEEEPEDGEAVSVAEIAPFEHPVLRHLLLYGPPGSGKSTLAKVIAAELQRVYDYLAQTCCEVSRRSRFITVTPSQLKEPAQLTRLVESLGWGDCLLIDEIHGLSREIEESLYSVLENFTYSVTRDNDHATMGVERCTIIGCTTLIGDVSQPLRDRMLAVQLEPSSLAALTDIVKATLPEPDSLKTYRGQRDAKILLLHHLVALRSGYDKPVLDGITDEAAELMAKRALGIPRIAKGIRSSAGAWAVVRGEAVDKIPIEAEDVEGACSALGIDNLGLHRSDRKVIEILAERGPNKPMGEAALAAAAMVSKGDLVSVIEPRLQHHELVVRTPRGRALSDAGQLLFGEQAEVAA